MLPKYGALYLYCIFFLQSRLCRRTGSFPDYWYMSRHSGKDCYHIRQYLKRKTRGPAGVTAESVISRSRFQDLDFKIETIRDNAYSIDKTATCITSHGGYKCACKAGFKGKQCEQGMLYKVYRLLHDFECYFIVVRNKQARLNFLR